MGRKPAAVVAVAMLAASCASGASSHRSPAVTTTATTTSTTTPLSPPGTKTVTTIHGLGPHPTAVTLGPGGYNGGSGFIPTTSTGH